MSSSTKAAGTPDAYSDMDARLDALLAEISANVHEVKSIMKEKKEQAADTVSAEEKAGLSQPEEISQMEDGLLKAAERIREEEATASPGDTREDDIPLPGETAEGEGTGYEETAPAGTQDTTETEGDDELKSNGWMAKRRLLKEKKTGRAAQESRADLQKMDIIDFDSSDLPEARDIPASGREAKAARAAARNDDRIQGYSGQPLRTASAPRDTGRAKTPDVDGILDDIKADSPEKPADPKAGTHAEPGKGTVQEAAAPTANNNPGDAASPGSRAEAADKTPAAAAGDNPQAPSSRPAAAQVPVSAPFQEPSADSSMDDVGRMIGQFLEYSNEFIKLQSAIIRLNDSVIDHQNELIQMKGEATSMIEKYNQMFENYRAEVQRMSNS